jgi:hypothetical protein
LFQQRGGGRFSTFRAAQRKTLRTSKPHVSLPKSRFTIVRFTGMSLRAWEGGRKP